MATNEEMEPQIMGYYCYESVGGAMDSEVVWQKSPEAVESSADDNEGVG